MKDLILQLKSHTWEEMKRADEARLALRQFGVAVIEPIMEAMGRNDLSGLEVYEVFLNLGDTGLKALAEGLRRGPLHLRRNAAWAFEILEAAAKPVFDALVTALQDEDLEVRKNIALALSKIGPEAVPPLMRSLEDQDSQMRAVAARSLGILGPVAKPALPKLISMANILGSPERANAVFALGLIGMEASQALPIFAQALEDPDPNVSHCAVWSMGNESQRTPQGMALLVKALDHSDESVGAQAAQSLGKWGRYARKAEQALLEAAVTNTSPRVRHECLKAAWDIGQSPSRVMKVMIQLMEKEGCEAFMCTIIEEIGAKGKVAVPYLVQALKADSADLRWAAVSALEAIGPGAHEATPALLEALRDPSGTVAGGAAGALASIGPRSTVPALLRALDDRNPRMREYAADALGSLGRSAKKAEKKLMTLLREDEVEEVRGWAAIALGEIAGRKEALFPLMSSLKSPNPNVRYRSARALGSLGKAGLPAIPALEDAAKDESEMVSTAARQSAERINGRR